MPKASEMLTANYPVGEPMVVYTGPKKSGTALIAAVATDSNQQTTRRGKRARVAAKKPDAGAEPKADAKPKVVEARPAAKPEAKPAAAAKPKLQHAAAKPDGAAKPADKPAAAAAPKPAKPAAAKPKPEAKPAS